MKNKIAIVVSLFNDEVTEKLLVQAQDTLLANGFSVDEFDIYEVPGAIEIPLMTKLLAKTNLYAAIITLGAVILGETDHYHYVCEQVSAGCMRVMLDLEIPVIFGVLTTKTYEQALARVHKGREVVEAAIKMLQTINSHFLSSHLNRK